MGHERLAQLSGPLNLSTTVTRAGAFRAAVSELLGPTTEPLVRHGGRFTIDVGRELTGELLRERRDITAIVAGNDMIALGCLDALRQAGVRCPQDVSVAGHNDMPLVGRLQPPLTTVAFGQRALGVRAAEVLLRRLASDAGPVERHLIRTELVVRGSTAPAPSGSPRRRWAAAA
jgi:LacI family transcriptional regulator